MIATTGWTAATLRAQPAGLVRALAWRIFAARAWSPGIAEAARRPVTRSLFAGTEQWVEAVRAREAAADALRAIEAALWPEDE